MFYAKLPGRQPRTVGSRSELIDHRVREDADSLDLDLDEVAGLQRNGWRPRVADPGRGAGEDQVARLEREDGRGKRDERPDAEDEVVGVPVLEAPRRSAAGRRAARSRRQVRTPGRAGRPSGQNVSKPFPRVHWLVRRTGGSVPRRRWRSGSRRRSRARRPRRSAGPVRPISTASSASASTCVASGGSTIASPGPISVFSNLPKSSGSAGGSSPLLADVLGVVQPVQMIFTS